MFHIFAEHAAPAAILMFNGGFDHGEGIGTYRGAAVPMSAYRRRSAPDPASGFGTTI
jgi:hypothetical protein